MLGEPLKLKVTSRMNKHISRFAVHMAHAPMGPILIGPNLLPNMRIEPRSEAMKISQSQSVLILIQLVSNSKCKNLYGKRETNGFFDNSNKNRWQNTTTSRKCINFILDNPDIDRS